jgi:hypothetical protein
MAVVAVGQKSVDSSSVSQKACPALVFERWLCGKAEEGFGKKGRDFWNRESKKLCSCQRKFFIIGAWFLSCKSSENNQFH